MSFLLAVLVLTASVSALFTVANLWQVKEWRFNRLREHLRSEGTLFQLLGVTRPLLILLFLPALIFRVISPELWTFGVLAALTVLTVVKLALGKQPSPVWTAKALAMVSVSAGMTLAATLVLIELLPAHRLPVVSILPLLQPVAIGIAWLLFLPLDHLLKRRIMERARALRSRHGSLIVIGVTGSVGKTTTKELLLHLLRDRGARATPAYVNTEIGVSRWMIAELSTPVPPKILIVEMGAYQGGEIALLAKIAQPQIGIITFIGTQHIALFGSQEKLLAAKAELFDALPEDGAAILNGDSPFAGALRDRARCRTVTVSTGGPADLEALDIEETGTGIRFRAGTTPVSVPLHGTHNVTNVLLAMAAAETAGLKRAECARALLTFRPPEHTFSVRTVGTVTLLDDTHNASSTSFSAAIQWAKEQPAEHKVLFSSGLIELGEEEDRVHAKLGQEAAGIFHRVIFTHARHARSFERGLGRPVEFFSKKTPPVPAGCLFVCIGRIPEQAIRRLLPGAETQRPTP